MEARTLRKMLTYAFAAVAAGLMIMLAPLITRAETRNDSQLGSVGRFTAGFRELEGSSSQSGLPKFSTSDLEILTACFVFALVFYMWFRSKQPHREYRWIGNIPY